MKIETLEEYLKRGGKIKKCETVEHAQGHFSKFKSKELIMKNILNRSQKFKRKPK